MSSRLMVKEKELIKHKEDNKLLIKCLRNRQEKTVETLTQEKNMNINQLKDDLSEMSSRLILKEKELLKQKEDNKLLLKRLKSRQERNVDTVTEGRLIQQKLLGSGRYGEVYTFNYDSKLYAGKIIHKNLLPGHPHPSFDQISKILIKFENASTWFDINQHSNVEIFHSIIQQTPNSPPIVLTELLHENLISYTTRMKGNLSVNEQLDLCHDVAKGLQFLHNLNVVHSNLHGANVFISTDGKAKIADYICPQIDTLNESTTSQYKVYLSPESVANKEIVSQQSDVYSLGVLFLQVATQNPPLPDENIEVFGVQRWKEQMDQIIKNPLQSLIAKCFTISEARPHIDDICDKIVITKESPQNVVHHVEATEVKQTKRERSHSSSTSKTSSMELVKKPKRDYPMYCKPTVKVLHSSGIISAIGTKWYDLGIALLDDDQMMHLKTIRKNNSEVTRCCIEMLMYWLETHFDATWNDLVEALKSPGVELNNVATMVEYTAQSQQKASTNPVIQQGEQDPLETDSNNTERNNKQVWVFGYGSIVWKPDFPYQHKVTGYIKGYARRFWQGSIHHRGKPGDPGRVAMLVEDQHECTYGLAFSIKDADVAKVMADLNKRERGYTTEYVLFYPTDNDNMPPFEVLCYTATESNPEYLGPAPVSSIARQIVNAAGHSGCNVEYLMKLARSMKEIAPLNNDEHLFTLEAEVIKLLPVNGTTCNCYFCTGKIHDGDRTLK